MMIKMKKINLIIISVLLGVILVSAGDLGNAGSSGFIDLIVGDIITLQVKNKDASDNIGVHSANLNLIRIGA